MSDLKHNFNSLLTNENLANFLKKHLINATSFDLDKFIMEYKKYINLSEIQNDLKVYYESICCDISELISNDYVDYIILSSTISGIDKYIKIMISSLDEVKITIAESKRVLEGILNFLTLMMTTKMLVREKKRSMCHILCVNERLKRIKELNSSNVGENCLSLSIVEQNAFYLGFIQFYCNANLDESSLSTNQENVKHIFETIMNQLKYYFLNSISINDSQTLYRILHIYLMVNKEKCAENIFRESCVKTYMQEHITEENILKYGIAKVYENILSFIPLHCSLILLLTGKIGKHTEIARGYDFLLNAVWPEIVQQLKNMPSTNVYAPQNVKDFQKNYSATLVFLQKLEQNCGTQANIKKLRDHNSYKEFLEIWNIDIYFRIVFMEIASRFEKAICMEFQNSNVNRKIRSNTIYVLNSSLSLQTCIEQCWNEEFFLLPLMYNFWKLTLQLVSRYNNWAHSCLRSKLKDIAMVLEIAVAFLADVELLVKHIQDIFTNKIEIHMQRGKLITSVKVAFYESIEMLKDVSICAQNVITESSTEQCNLYLMHTTDIPKLFRKTNKEIPSKQSEYVILLSNFIEEFLAHIGSLLSEEQNVYFLTHITNTVTKQWVNIIQEVLTSVIKIEKSLKILKRAKTKTSSETDVGKIKHQLKLDVNYMKGFFQKLNVENEDNYNKLMSTINSF